MTLIAMLISLVAEHFLRHLQDLRRLEWFSAYYRWLYVRCSRFALWHGPTGVLLTVVPVALLVGVVYGLLARVAFGIPGFIVAVLVLLYCLGPRDLEGQVETFLEAWRQGDREGALLHAGDLLENHVGEDNAEVTQAMIESILVQANERLFGVLFWFGVLGPLGAALFRLSAALKTRAKQSDSAALPGFAEAAQRLYWVMAWVPARLVALSYSLTGSFDEAIHAWRIYREQGAGRFTDSNVGVLVAAGAGAVRLEQEDIGEYDREASGELVRTALSLVLRALVLWLTVIALMTLAGWAG
ncbi:MAG: regulatory signaling modulator protein AmpE [Gammaproteobacteria bacterium]|nr:regulatory signaling modulator protein AmpE [Gammaproteobacteria bacterium]